MLRDLHGVNKENVGVFNCDIQDGCRDFGSHFESRTSLHMKRDGILLYGKRNLRHFRIIFLVMF